MKGDCKTNKMNENAGSITLRGYYKALPNASYPKADFTRLASRRCNVSEGTVRNWINYGMKPNNPAHILILSELTGIEESKLWEGKK